MKCSEIAQKLNLTVQAGETGLDTEAGYCYICDLLSLAMAKLQQGNVWITVQTNLNTVAVASLTGAACIIIPDGLKPDEDTVKKADAEGICIFTSESSAYDIACSLKDLGI